MNHKLHSLIAATLAGSVMMGFGANAMADSTDDIVNALIAKGVLTEEEGALLQKGRAGEKEAAEKKAKSAVTAKYKDGIVIGTEDGQNSIQINGRLHADYRDFGYEDENKAAANSGSTSGSDTFDIRRARIGVKARFLDHYEGEIVINNTVGTNNTSDTTLDVAYLNVAWWKPAQLRIGQFKMPFSLEQLTSSNNIDFVERSVVDRYVAGKEIGAMIHGAPFKGFTYGVAMSNGRGQNATENDNRADGKDFMGRVTANFAEIAEINNAVLHAGLAYSKGDISKGDGLGGNRGPETNSGITYYTSPAVAAVNGVDNEIDRTRLGLEAAAAYGPFKLQSQYLTTNYDYKATAARNVDVDIKTFYVQALWTITGESHADRYKNGAFSGIKPAKNFDPATLSGGAWEIGARYAKFDASDVANENIGATGFAKSDAWTYGVKFVANPHVRFMLDYVKTDFEDAIANNRGINVNGKLEKDERAILFRTQIAF